jgi:hypothetical protein
VFANRQLWGDRQTEDLRLAGVRVTWAERPADTRRLIIDALRPAFI